MGFVSPLFHFRPCPAPSKGVSYKRGQSWNLEFCHLFSQDRSCFDLSFPGLIRYCRTLWLTLLALFKFRRSAIQSWRWCACAGHRHLSPIVFRPPRDRAFFRVKGSAHRRGGLRPRLRSLSHLQCCGICAILKHNRRNRVGRRGDRGEESGGFWEGSWGRRGGWGKAGLGAERGERGR